MGNSTQMGESAGKRRKMPKFGHYSLEYDSRHSMHLPYANPRRTSKLFQFRKKCRQGIYFAQNLTKVENLRFFEKIIFFKNGLKALFLGLTQ